MRTQFTKLALAAGFGLALAFTFITTTTSYDSDGNVTSIRNDGRTEYEYDANGNRTKAVYYNADGNITIKSETTYTYIKI